MRATSPRRSLRHQRPNESKQPPVKTPNRSTLQKSISLNKETISPKRTLRRSISSQSPQTFKVPEPVTTYRTPRRTCKDNALEKIQLSSVLLNLDSPEENHEKRKAIFSSSSDVLASPTRQFSRLSIQNPKSIQKPPVCPAKTINRRFTDVSNRTKTKPKTEPLKVFETAKTTKKFDEDYVCESSNTETESSEPDSSSSSNEASSIDEEIYEVVKSSRKNVRKLLPVNAIKSQQKKVLKEKLDELIAVSGCLPCRESEFEEIYEFVMGKLLDGVGGCMYIAGLPGTGKTATVQAVLGSVQRELLDVKIKQGLDKSLRIIQINGMHVTDTKQVYVEVYHQLTGQKIKAKNAAELLEREFCAPATNSGKRRLGGGARTKISQVSLPSCVLVIDELDLLCTRRQDVLYNLFDWPTRRVGKRLLIVICIANTMDLPERMLHHRVSSRLGLSRLTFAPYSHDQLAIIVQKRIFPDSSQKPRGRTSVKPNEKLKTSFDPKAIELAARKVAAVSGDARRALEICRRALDLAEADGKIFGINHIDKVLKEMFVSPKVQAIRQGTSRSEKLLLRALISELKNREETRIGHLYDHMLEFCKLEGLSTPSESEVITMCASLGAHKLLLVEPTIRELESFVRLNCAQSDIVMALKD